MHISKRALKLAIATATIFTVMSASASSNDHTATNCNSRKEVGLFDNSNGKLTTRATAVGNKTPVKTPRNVKGQR